MPALSAREPDPASVVLADLPLASSVRAHADDFDLLKRARTLMCAAAQAVFDAHDAACSAPARDPPPNAGEILHAVETAVSRALAAASSEGIASAERRADADRAALTETLQRDALALQLQLRGLHADMRDGQRAAMADILPPLVSSALLTGDGPVSKLASDVAIVRDRLGQVATRDDARAIQRTQEAAAARVAEVACARSAADASSSVKGRAAKESMLMALQSRLLGRDGWLVQGCKLQSATFQLTLNYKCFN
jgi:hypothetical protein